jgi:hypothetical protein
MTEIFSGETIHPVDSLIDEQRILLVLGASQDVPTAVGAVPVAGESVLTAGDVHVAGEAVLAAGGTFLPCRQIKGCSKLTDTYI